VMKFRRIKRKFADIQLDKLATFFSGERYYERKSKAHVNQLFLLQAELFAAVI